MRGRTRMSTGKDFSLMIINPYQPDLGQQIIPLQDVWEVEEDSEIDKTKGIHGDTQSFVSNNGFTVKFKVLDIQSEVIEMLENIYDNSKTFTATAEDAHKILESNECSFTDKREFNNGKSDRGVTFTIQFPPSSLSRKKYNP